MTDLRTVLAFDRAVQRRNDARGQRPVQTERIADRENLLSHAQIVTGPDCNGHRLILGHANLQHRDVVGEAGADQRCLVVATVRQLYVRRSGAGDDVHIRDDMSGCIPDEPRPRAARHAGHVARPEIHDALGRGDVDDR